MKNVIDAQTAIYNEWTKAFTKQMNNIPEYAKKMSEPDVLVNFTRNLPHNDMSNYLFENYIKWCNQTIDYQKSVVNFIEQSFINLNLIKK